MTAREIRLLNLAARRGLLLRRPNPRDFAAARYGLISADLETPALEEARVAEFSMSIDEVEVRLCGAEDFDVYFQDPRGDYRWTGKPSLEWRMSYHFGGGWAQGWLLIEPGNGTRDHLILVGRDELTQATLVARDMVDYWQQQDAERAPSI